MEDSIIQFLLCHSPSKNVNDYNDKGDNSSPIAEEAENDNLNNNLDNLFDKGVEDNFVQNKEGDHGKDEDSSKPLEHKNVKTRKKKKKKNRSEELDNRENNNDNKHDKSSNTTELITIIEVSHPLIQKRLFSFWVIVWSRKLMVLPNKKH